MAKTTTASEYVFEPDVPGCKLAALETAFNALRDRRILMCGDSMIGQLWIETLCLFKRKLLRVNNVLPPFPPELRWTEGKYSMTHYHPSWAVDRWRQLQNSTPWRLVPSADFNERLVSYENGVPKYYAGNKELSAGFFEHNLTIVKYHGGHQLANSTHDCVLGIPEWMGWQPSSIDTIITHHGYTRPDHIAALVSSRADLRHIRVVALPYNGYGTHSNNGPRPQTWASAPDASKGRKRPNKAAETTATEAELRAGQEDRPELLTAAEEARRAPPAMIGEKSATYVNLKEGLAALHHSRKFDAKATFYPIKYPLYNKSTGAYLGEKTCSKGMSQPLEKTCPIDWHPCRQAPCKANLLEGHYCMPGPLDSILRIVYNVAAYPE